MYFFDVEAPVTHQVAGEQQHGNLVAIAHFRGVVGVDVNHVDREGLRRRQCGEFVQHLLAQSAPGAGIHQEARRPEHPALQRRGTGASMEDLTECAMNSTV
jgi:hypothetical protein